LIQLTKREKVFIAIFIVVSVMAVYYVYFYQPLIRDIEAMSAEMEAVQDLPVLSKSKQEQLASLKREYETLSKRVSETLESLRSPDDQPGLVVHLYRIFSTRSIREYIEFGDLEQHTDFSVMPVSVTLSASYSDFKDILRQLEQSPYKNHIQALTVQALDGGSTVTVNMSIKFYFKPMPAGQELNYPFMDGLYGRPNPFQLPGQ